MKVTEKEQIFVEVEDLGRDGGLLAPVPQGKEINPIKEFQQSGTKYYRKQFHIAGVKSHIPVYKCLWIEEERFPENLDELQKVVTFMRADMKEFLEIMKDSLGEWDPEDDPPLQMFF
jgi:hypothetical protein